MSYLWSETVTRRVERRAKPKDQSRPQPDVRRALAAKKKLIKRAKKAGPLDW